MATTTAPVWADDAQRVADSVLGAMSRVFGPQPDAIIDVCRAALIAADTGGVFSDIAVALENADVREAIAGSPLIETVAVSAADDAVIGGASPFVLAGTRLYARRLFRAERVVARGLAELARRTPSAAEVAPAVADCYFPDAATRADDRQFVAVRTALTHRLVVVAGGPGTGKTRTVAAIIAALRADAAGRGAREPTIVLCAPTGKAAARLAESVARELDPSHGTAPGGSTIHRVLGRAEPDHLTSVGFRHGPDDPIAADVVVVDEMSMVSLPLMAALMAALPDSCRLVLVGDPFQLASVEAGAVFRDVVAGLGEPATSASPLVVLTRQYRFDSGSGIARLAETIRCGDEGGVLSILRESADPAAHSSELDVTWVDSATAATGAAALSAAPVRGLLAAAVGAVVGPAKRGDAPSALDALTATRVLSAARRGPWGTDSLNTWMEELARGPTTAWDRAERFYVGQPLLVTANDYVNDLFNGDVCVVVRGADDEVRCAIDAPTSVRFVPPSRLAAVDTSWAMTVHRTQGSEFDHVIVVLPPPPHALLTREMLYTAVTRARSRLTVVADMAAVSACVTNPTVRSSGLAELLVP